MALETNTSFSQNKFIQLSNLQAFWGSIKTYLGNNYYTITGVDNLLATEKGRITNLENTVNAAEGGVANLGTRLGALETSAVKSVVIDNVAGTFENGTVTFSPDFALYSELEALETTVNNKIAGLVHLSVELVDSFDKLPSTGALGVIYLVADEGSLTGERVEYIWTGSAYEKIGTTATDLTNYYTKSEVYIKSEVDGAISTAVTTAQTTLANSISAVDAKLGAGFSAEATVAGKIAELEEDIEGIVTAGGQPNVIEVVKLNGNALTVTDKAVDIVLSDYALKTDVDTAVANAKAEIKVTTDALAGRVTALESAVDSIVFASNADVIALVV